MTLSQGIVRAISGVSNEVQDGILPVATTQGNHKPSPCSTDGDVDQALTLSRLQPARVTSNRVEQDCMSLTALGPVDRRYGNAVELKFSEAAFDPVSLSAERRNHENLLGSNVADEAEHRLANELH